MNKWFSFDTYENDYEFFDTEEEAKKNAEKILEIYRDEAPSDGWPEDLDDCIGYGKVVASTVEKVVAEKKDFTDEEWEEKGYSFDWDKIVDYELHPLPGYRKPARKDSICYRRRDDSDKK